MNVASFVTEGYDFTLEYLLDPSTFGASGNWGRFNLRLIGNKLEELTYVNLPGSAPDDDLGEEDAPEWQLKFDLTWARGRLLLNYGFDYFDQTKRFTTSSNDQVLDPDIAADGYLEYEERFVQDVYGSYDVTEGFSLFAGIDNLTNEKPDVGETFYPVSAVGRFFFLGVRYNRNR